MATTIIRAYQPTDEADLLRIWNDALWADPINTTIWRTKVLLDPNFDPAGCFVAETDRHVSGFLLSIVRRVPFFNDGLQPDQAWITAFGVDPSMQNQGIGSALLDAAIIRLQQLGCTRVALSPYVPNYFTPGADIHAYAPGVRFLQHREFQIIEQPISMRADLTGFQIPPSIAARTAALAQTGIHVRPVTASDIVPLLPFIARYFSWDWHREASGVLHDLYASDPRFVGMVVAHQGEHILGYAQHRGERFGPFGVQPDQRSHGIGRVILATMLREMLQKQFHAAWFLWTGENAARLYSQCGFQEVRRFAILQKNL